MTTVEISHNHHGLTILPPGSPDRSSASTFSSTSGVSSPVASPKPVLKKKMSLDGKLLASISPKVSKKVSFSGENEIFEAEMKFDKIPVSPNTASSGEDSPSIKYTNSPKSGRKGRKDKVSDSLKVEIQTSRESCCATPDNWKQILSFFMF